MLDCNAPATPISSKRKMARLTWCICADGRCQIAVAALWVVRRRFRKWFGARMTGCGRWMDREFLLSKHPRPRCAKKDKPGAKMRLAASRKLFVVRSEERR